MGIQNRLAITFTIFALSSNFLFACTLFAQHEGMMMSMPESHEYSMGSMLMNGMYGQYPMTREASGTSWQPDSAPAEGFSFMQKDWMLMIAGYANVIYDRQNGQRGDEKTFSTNMFMFMAQRPLGEGTFGFRSMLSLDPLIGKNGYPLLLQNGETADGMTPLVDRQHPHDLFMELAVTYSLPISSDRSLFIYLGLPGEPALGPPAFMHRLSGIDIPGAPITHHWLDSTHITYGVGTIGVIWKSFKLEGSAFKGREPDQYRWDIESPAFDSVSGRISFNPTGDWSMQASFGYIKSPEQLEPDVNTRRTTASVIYNRTLENNTWQTTLAWGRNDNTRGKVLDGFLLESAIRIREMHTLFGRFEKVEKDELFPDDHPFHGKGFNVNKLSLGYIYDMSARDHLRWGIGGSLDINIIPNDLKPIYGDSPKGYMLFVRVKLD